MYAERASRLPHVVAWRSVAPPGGRVSRILPDGCLDIIWQDGRVFVAGPDTTAQVGASTGGARMFALRFGAGLGPAVLGVPADEVLDRRVPLADLWPAADVRRLAEADDPMAALEAAALARRPGPDRAMGAVAAGARAGRAVDAIAFRTAAESAVVGSYCAGTVVIASPPGRQGGERAPRRRRRRPAGPRPGGR